MFYTCVKHTVCIKHAWIYQFLFNSSANTALECGRNPIVHQCGSAFYNALVDISGPFFETLAPNCKVTVKKVADGGAANLSNSFILFSVSIVCARFML